MELSSANPSAGAATQVPRKRAQIFLHSPWDAVLLTLAAVELTMTTYGTLRVDAIPWPVAFALGVACIALNCTNYQCVAHNFIHLPFFRARRANRIFSVFNTLALKAPQSMYRVHHLNHHRHNNDTPNSASGQVSDRSSTYRRARADGSEERLLSYAFLGPIRGEIGVLWAGAVRRDRPLAWTELSCLLAFVGLLTALNWRGVLLFLLPVWYLGQVCALAENYLEHHGAQPGNRLTDSVSCYASLYNLVWFNNGYHQEHHYSPQVHWTKVKALRARMVPESERRVVPYAHAWNLLTPLEPGRGRVKPAAGCRGDRAAC